jgi:transposase
MLIQTVLNRVEKYKSFVYGRIRFSEAGGGQPALEVEIRARAGSKPICSGCGQEGPGYDHLPARRFEFIPMWGFLVFFIYALRRVDCPRCGVRVEKVPWAVGKHHLTITYGWFLAGWAKRLSWREVAASFHTSWYQVFCGVRMAVAWGREHMNLENITAVGVDELQWGSGHRYITVVYQINEACRRLLWIGEKRTEKTFEAFFDWLGQERAGRLEYVCSDMWKPYLKVIARRARQVTHILDRFHIMTHFSKAIDKVRAQEAKELKAKGLAPVLKGSRWLFLKRVENMTFRQIEKLADILRWNLKTVKCYLLKEDFQSFWEYNSVHWASRFLEQWCTRTMRSRIEPMKKVAAMIRRHKGLILNWFRAKKQFSSGIVEGLNNKARSTTKRAYGFRTFNCLEISLYHTLGHLPEPRFTHKFF